MRTILSLAAAAAALTANANATILTFEQSSSGVATTDTPTALAGDYGDRVAGPAQDGYTYGVGDEGFTPNVQVGFTSPDPAVVSVGFGDLQDVLFERTPGTDPIIGFQADEGFLASLFSFELTSRGSDILVEQIVVTDDTGLVFELSDIQLFASGSETIDFTRLTGGPLTGRQLDIRVVLSSLGAGSVDVAFDNFRFGQVAVASEIPLPGAALLLATGAVVLVRRRGR